MRHNIQQCKEGFVILIAVVVASLLLTLGAFIASIAVRELALSISGRNSQTAFYAADTAIECALFQDIKVRQFATSTGDDSMSTVRCNAGTTTVTVLSSNSTSATSEFTVHLLREGFSTSTSPYAIVTIEKTDIGQPTESTVIESRGYNVFDNNASSRVERALKVNY